MTSFSLKVQSTTTKSGFICFPGKSSTDRGTASLCRLLCVLVSHNQQQTAGIPTYHVTFLSLKDDTETIECQIREYVSTGKKLRVISGF